MGICPGPVPASQSRELPKGLENATLSLQQTRRGCSWDLRRQPRSRVRAQPGCSILLPTGLSPGC